MPRTYTAVVTLSDDDLADYGTDDEVVAYLEARLAAFPSPTSEAVPQRVAVLDPTVTGYVRDCLAIDDGEHAPDGYVADKAWQAFALAPVDTVAPDRPCVVCGSDRDEHTLAQHDYKGE